MAGEHVFLGEIEAKPKPGPYANAITAAKQAGTEYWAIGNIFAFHPMASHHLCELSHELMHKEGPLSAALCESIEAYTSSLTYCGFCMHAYAAVAAHLYGDPELVHGVLSDPKTSALTEKRKVPLRFVRRLTLQPSAITQEDMDTQQQAGSDKPSIYSATCACALFNDQNHFVLGNGVGLVSGETLDRLSAHKARTGYSREQPTHSQKEHASCV